MTSFPSELRHSRLSDRWVMIAAGRNKRPHQFPAVSANKSSRDPFTPANITASDVIAVIPDHPAGVVPKVWDVLSIRNAFPFVAAEQEPRRIRGGTRDGFGYHEIVIHSPEAEKNFEDFSPEQTGRVLEMFIDRYVDLSSRPHVKHVQVFTNRGPSAGASVGHPHSQIVALPVVPPYVSRVIKAADVHRDTGGSELVEDELFDERKAGDRIIKESEHFVAYAPFAPRANYHIRVVPLDEAARFQELAGDARLDLAQLINDLYRALNAVSGTPDYNAFIRTPPTDLPTPKAFRWHLDIVPHFAVPGGLELATGLDVITVTPETSAAELRKAL